MYKTFVVLVLCTIVVSSSSLPLLVQSWSDVDKVYKLAANSINAALTLESFDKSTGKRISIYTDPIDIALDVPVPARVNVTSIPVMNVAPDTFVIKGEIIIAF